MKVTEQVDALETLAYDRYSYLVVPRVLAATLMFPVVTAFAVAVGVLSGWITAINLLDLSTTEFLKGLKQFYQFKDVWFGLVKSASFGFAVALMGCLRGLATEGGAQGVGSVHHQCGRARLRGDSGARRLLGAGASMIVLDRLTKSFGVQRSPERALAGGARWPEHRHHRAVRGREERHSQADRADCSSPDGGRVLVDGADVGDMDRDELAALRGRIGYVFQFAALFDS